MSSQARTQRVQRMQVLMSCWIIDVAGTLVAGAERQLVVVADRDVVLDDVPLELVAGMGSGRRSRRCSPG